MGNRAIRDFQSRESFNGSQANDIQLDESSIGETAGNNGIQEASSDVEHNA